MAVIDELETDVNSLSDDDDDPTFRITYRRIKAALLLAKTENEVERVRTILRTFRGRIPSSRPTLNNVKTSAKELDEKLTVLSLEEIFHSVRSRNEAVKDVRAKLQVEISKGNADAALLRKIKNAVEQATSVVTGIGETLDQLTATNGSIVSKIRALLLTINNIGRAFDPDAA